MKNVVLSVLLAFSFVFLSAGCKKEDTSPKVDGSLAGSVVFHYPYWILEAECSVGDRKFSGLDTEISVMDVDKVTDNSVRLFFFTVWENDTLSIDIPEVAINGSRFDVAFGSGLKDCDCELNGDVLTLPDVRISGYIRLSAESKAESYELAYNQYDVDLTLSSAGTGDGNSLEFKVMSVTRDLF